MKKAVRDTMPVERIKEIINYDPLTGIFTWKAKTRHNMPAIGKKAGGMRNGYYYIRIDEVDYSATRIAWAIMKNESPECRLAFKDKDKSNLKWDNLVTQFFLKGYDSKSHEGRREYNKAHREKYPQVFRDSHLRSNFGITLHDYEDMFLAQDGKCAICKKRETGIRLGKEIGLSVDHCHETGGVRGLLCRACNVGIGCFKDNIESITNAISYLNNHKEKQKSLPASNVIPLNAKGVK